MTEKLKLKPGVFRDLSHQRVSQIAYVLTRISESPSHDSPTSLIPGERWQLCVNAGPLLRQATARGAAAVAAGAGTNCIKIGLPGKSILRDYFQESMTS